MGVLTVKGVLCSISEFPSQLSSTILITSFPLPPQEVKGWYLGEQQHILGATEGPWLHPNRFPCTLVTAEQQILHILNCTTSTVIKTGFCIHSLTINIQHRSSLLRFIKVIALIASAYLSCVNMFMQTFYRIAESFGKCCPSFHPIRYTVPHKPRKEKLLGMKKN